MVGVLCVFVDKDERIVWIYVLHALLSCLLVCVEEHERKPPSDKKFAGSVSWSLETQVFIGWSIVSFPSTYSCA